MKPRIALMIAGGILLVAANMVQKNGRVDQIAAMEEQELRSASATTISQMTGFTPDGQIGPQEEVNDREDMGSQPVIEDFDWSKSRSADDDADTSPEPPSGIASLRSQGASALAPGQVDRDFDPTLVRR